MNLLVSLWRSRLANTLVKTFRINRLVDVYLSRFPVKRQTPFGLVYEAMSVPSLLVANEIFATETYIDPVSMIRPKTFVDLGANVGYFPLLIAEVVGSRSIKGLCVEPNPQLHGQIESHLRANRLEDVHCIKGVVASNDAGTETDFFLNPSDIASSLTGNFNPRLPVGGRVRKIKVPVVDIAQEWRRFFGDERIDLLKIDIEGAEVAFLKAHSSFLQGVDAIVIEWHAWITTLEEVSSILEPSGFVLERVGPDEPDAGTALFRRKTRSS